MLTTVQAAAKLEISPRRVIALLQSGDLTGEKFGRSWMVDDTSVERRLSQPRLRGRPAMGVRDQSRVERYTLMNREHEVAEFTYDRQGRRAGCLRPLADAAYAPPGICGVGGAMNEVNLNGWLAERHIPPARPGLSELLRACGCESPSELMFRSLGLCLSDQYWFRPAGTSVRWRDVNFFDNDYEDVPQAGGQAGKGSGRPRPGATTGGQLVKWWERRGDVSYLVKGCGGTHREPWAELLASRLCERLLDSDDFVPYEVETHDGRPFSTCPCFVTAHTELVPMRDMLLRFGSGYPKSPYENYASMLERLGIAGARRKLAKMIVCDFLDANSDRHEGNLGVMRDAESLEWLSVAPLFDNGRAFYFDAASPDDLGRGLYRYEANPFEARPLAQLALVDDFAWFDPARLDGFGDEIVETLARNDRAPAWFPEAAAAQFARRLERVTEAALEAGR